MQREIKQLHMTQDYIVYIDKSRFEMLHRRFIYNAPISIIHLYSLLELCSNCTLRPHASPAKKDRMFTSVDVGCGSHKHRPLSASFSALRR